MTSGEVSCLADSATTHIVLRKRIYFTNFVPKNAPLTTLSGPSKEGNKAHKHPNLAPKAPNFKNKGKAPTTMDDNMCYRCGSKDHWSRVCRAPKKVIDEYHSRRKKFESNFMQVDEPETTKMEVSDFQEDTTPMED